MLISVNPSEDAERLALEDAGVFNVLKPLDFEKVYRAVLGEVDERTEEEREEADMIDGLAETIARGHGAW